MIFKQLTKNGRKKEGSERGKKTKFLTASRKFGGQLETSLFSVSQLNTVIDE